MRVVLSLFALFCALFADDVAQNTTDSAKNAESNKVAESVAKVADSVAKVADSAPVIIDPDTKLKDDIVSFERDKFFKEKDDVADVEDPFIYIYRQPEDAAERAARVAQLEQNLLTLKVKGIFISPESEEDSVNKRYIAKINDEWVRECRMVDKRQECDEIAGWKVINISEDKVTLRVDKYKKELGDRDLDVIPEKVEIKVAEFNYE